MKNVKIYLVFFLVFFGCSNITVDSPNFANGDGSPIKAKFIDELTNSLSTVEWVIWTETEDGFDTLSHGVTGTDGVLAVNLEGNSLLQLEAQTSGYHVVMPFFHSSLIESDLGTVELKKAVELVARYENSDTDHFEVVVRDYPWSVNMISGKALFTSLPKGESYEFLLKDKSANKVIASKSVYLNADMNEVVFEVE